MPSGRNIHTVKPYALPSLDEDAIGRLRVPLDAGTVAVTRDDVDSSDDERDTGVGLSLPSQVPTNMVPGTYY